MKNPATSITTDEQLAEIERLEAFIHSLREALPYADGQAYYNDKRKIAQMEAELFNLRRTYRTGERGGEENKA